MDGINVLKRQTIFERNIRDEIKETALQMQNNLKDYTGADKT